MDCSICGGEIKIGTLEKIQGTYVRKGGKMHPVCKNCQKEFKEGLGERIGKRKKAA